MAPRTWLLRALAAALPGLLLSGCFDEPPIPESGIPVFGDTFATGFTPNAFQGSLLTSLSVDSSKAYSGTASIKLEVPSSASNPGYSGGAVLADQPQDLSGTNALVFWATASRAATFDKIGFGLNFNPYPSTYQITLFNLPITDAWTRHFIPIPDPSKLKAERGMLWWADSDPIAYTAWLDDVKYDRLDAAAMALQPAIATATVTIGLGATAQVGGLSLRYTDFDGTQRSVDSTAQGAGPAPAYFAFASSNTSVATVDASGKITGVGLGQATVTASLGGMAAAGSITVNVGNAPPTAPTTAPPAPTPAAANVISLLSKAYSNVAVDTWGTSWSNNNAGPNLTDLTIAGDAMKKYTGLAYVGVEFIGTPPGTNEIDASAMTHFHVDVWTPDITNFQVKLVDFGPNMIFAGTPNDDTDALFTATSTSTPALTGTGQWVSLDIPLASFVPTGGSWNRSHLAQLLFISGTGTGTVFVDNVYFHK
jgi:hypothetical protein